jgi:hypothetical protein
VAEAELEVARAVPPTEQAVNPVYVKLKELLVDIETDLAGLRARQETLEAYREDLTAVLDVAYDFESRIDTLSAELRKIEEPQRLAGRRSIRPPAETPDYPKPILIFADAPEGGDNPAMPGQPR